MDEIILSVRILNVDLETVIAVVFTVDVAADIDCSVVAVVFTVDVEPDIDCSVVAVAFVDVATNIDCSVVAVVFTADVAADIVDVAADIGCSVVAVNVNVIYFGENDMTEVDVIDDTIDFGIAVLVVGCCVDVFVDAIDAVVELSEIEFVGVFVSTTAVDVVCGEIFKLNAFVGAAVSFVLTNELSLVVEPGDNISELVVKFIDVCNIIEVVKIIPIDDFWKVLYLEEKSFCEQH